MARHARVAPGGLIYHVLNRSAGRIRLFRKDADFEAFERIMAEAQALHPIRILSWCIMPNHWHFVVRPRRDGEVTAFFRWLAHTHAMRWRVSRRTVGYGHLYQGRFKCFPVQDDGHVLKLCRYVERNPLTAGLVKRAEQWRWSSLWTARHGSAAQKVMLSAWPVPRPRRWVYHVNEPLTPKELERVRISLRRDRPFGSEAWTQRAAGRLGLEHTLRPEGRPRKQEKSNAEN
jgi:putative transposase